MIKVDSSKIGLVRGVVIFSQWRAGCIGIDQAKDEDNVYVNVAYTPWHRHDENPSVVEKELMMLSRCYGRLQSHEAQMLYFEYRPYRK